MKHARLQTCRGGNERDHARDGTEEVRRRSLTTETWCVSRETGCGSPAENSGVALGDRALPFKAKIRYRWIREATGVVFRVLLAVISPAKNLGDSQMFKKLRFGFRRNYAFLRDFTLNKGEGWRLEPGVRNTEA